VMITQLAGHEHMTDWGMRIISNKSPIYSGAGYHYGSVWPLFTGWAAVGEYRYHREQSAYANLRANALLALDGSPGHVTEVLSGDYYQTLSTGSPHQIWSAAMVISPVLRGMLGLLTDASKHSATLRPHVPASWKQLTIRDVRVGDTSFDANYRKTTDGIVLELIRSAGQDECTLEFSPSISLRGRVLKVELNGKPVPFKIEESENDQHVGVHIPVTTMKSSLRIVLANDFGVSVQNGLPALGTASQGVRITSERWSASRDQLDLDVSGVAGRGYKLYVSNGAEIGSVDDAKLVSAADSTQFLWVEMPKGDKDAYAHQRVVIHFGAKATKH